MYANFNYHCLFLQAVLWFSVYRNNVDISFLIMTLWVFSQFFLNTQYVQLEWVNGQFVWDKNQGHKKFKVADLGI